MPDRPTPEQLDLMADAVQDAARALSRVLEVWHAEQLDGMTWDPGTGYPFAESLEEQTASVWAWHETIVTERETGIPPELQKHA